MTKPLDPKRTILYEIRTGVGVFEIQGTKKILVHSFTDEKKSFDNFDYWEEDDIVPD